MVYINLCSGDLQSPNVICMFRIYIRAMIMDVEVCVVRTAAVGKQAHAVRA